MQLVKRVDCPTCGASHSKQLLSYPMTGPLISEYLTGYYKNIVPIAELEGASYVLKQCLNCRFIWQAEILPDDGMEQLYERWINADGSRTKKVREDAYARIGHSRECIQILRAIDGKAHEIRVLDFGAGWGNWLLMARAFGFQADAVEISPSRRKQLTSLGLTVMEPDEIPAGTYAFINAEQVFEHIPDPAGTILQCHQWLTRGGLLRIAVPYGAGVERRIAAGKWKVDESATRPLEHINVFTPDTLRRLGFDHGFQVYHPPIVLPMIGLTFRDLKRFVGTMGSQLLTRAGLLPRTKIWLRKT